MTDKKPVTRSTALAPAPSPEGSLSRYLTDIRKFPCSKRKKNMIWPRSMLKKLR